MDAEHYLVKPITFAQVETALARCAPLLAGLCIIAVSLLFQTILPIFEPVRFGWQTDNAGFILILLLAGGLWFDTVNAYAGRTALAENIRLMKNQFALQEENYQIISGNFDQIRQMRHNLCENQAANAILNYYMRIAREKEIPLEIKVSLPAGLKLEGYNLGILLGNLLENAMDASENLPVSKRMVKVYSRI